MLNTKTAAIIYKVFELSLCGLMLVWFNRLPPRFVGSFTQIVELNFNMFFMSIK